LNGFGMVWWLVTFCCQKGHLEQKWMDPDENDLIIHDDYAEKQLFLCEQMCDCLFHEKDTSLLDGSSVGLVARSFLEHLAFYGTDETILIKSPLPGGDEYCVNMGGEEVLRLQVLSRISLTALVGSQCFEQALQVMSTHIHVVPKGMGHYLLASKDYYELRLAKESGAKVQIFSKGIPSRSQAIIEVKGESQEEIKKFKKALNDITFQCLNAPLPREDDTHVKDASLILFEGSKDDSDAVTFTHYLGGNTGDYMYHLYHEGRSLYSALLCQQSEENDWRQIGQLKFQDHMLQQMELLDFYSESINPKNKKKICEAEFSATIRFGTFYLLNLSDSFRGASSGLVTVQDLNESLTRGRKLFEPTEEEAKELQKDEEEMSDVAADSPKEQLHLQRSPFEIAENSKPKSQTLLGLPSSFFTYLPIDIEDSEEFVDSLQESGTTIEVEEKTSYSLTFCHNATDLKLTFEKSADGNFVLRKKRIRNVRWSAVTLVTHSNESPETREPLHVRFYLDMQQEANEENTCFLNNVADSYILKEGNNGLSVNPKILDSESLKSMTLRKSKCREIKQEGGFTLLFSEIQEHQYVSGNGLFQSVRERLELDCVLPYDPKVIGEEGPQAFLKKFWEQGLRVVDATKQYFQEKSTSNIQTNVS